VESNGAGHNGSGILQAAGGRAVAPPPDKVRDLAEGCVRFVQRAVGVTLDYEPETLSILDHYVEQARQAAGGRPEAAAVVAHAAGAYFGEVVRRRHASWWRVEGDDPAGWRIELEPVYLSFSPVQLIADALYRGTGETEDESDVGEQLEIDDADREAVKGRLAELPEVSEEEFYAPSTRLEVLDIAVEAIRARRMADGDEGDAIFGPKDYDD
jgi:hypothetical protein